MPVGQTLQQKLKQTLHLAPAFKLVWRSSRWLTLARIVLIVVQGILPLFTIYLAKLIVDTVAANLGTDNPEAAFRRVLVYLLLAGGVTIVQSLSNSLSELINQTHSLQVTDYMQGIIQTKSVEADLEYYENPRYHDTLQRAQQEAPYRPPQIINRLALAGQNLILLLAMVGLLLAVHWSFVSILFIAAIPAALVRVKHTRRKYHWLRKRTQTERQSQYLAFMVTSDHFAKEIRLFNLGQFFTKWYARLRKELFKERVALATEYATQNFLAQAFAGAIVFAVYTYIVAQTLKGVFQLGDLVLYYQALQRGQNALKGLLGGLSGLYEDNLFLSNLYEFLDVQPKLIYPVNPKPIPTLQQGIVFEQVSFRYSDSSRQALDSINLTVRPGQTIALVGENGSGKTTLIKLLCRLYDPSEGKITIDGINLSDFDPYELRRQISVIFQDYAKYHFSAGDNIRVGNLAVSQEDPSIVDAAKRSGADQIIQQLPQGYNTILGRMFDGGEELSIGQWQKVALARAFLRDSQVIVLDEPTSAMDPKSEYQVFQELHQLIDRQAVILITHRLSTVRMADCIYVMEQGRIVESGTHSELMELQGTYAHLFETQARNYR